MKIMSNKEYAELIRLLKESYIIVKKLQAENDALKAAMRTKTLYIDFPATKKLHEDKNY